MEGFESVADRMEELLGQLDGLAETDRALVFEVLGGLDAMHRSALTELLGAIPHGEIERLREHSDAVAWLCDAYGLGLDQHAAAEQALETIRPYIHSHGGRVDLLEVVDGQVHVRMSGSCSGCTASATTLTDGIEQALRENMPGFDQVVAEEEPGESHPPPGPVLVQLQARPPDDWR